MLNILKEPVRSTETTEYYYQDRQNVVYFLKEIKHHPTVGFLIGIYGDDNKEITFHYHGLKIKSHEIPSI